MTTDKRVLVVVRGLGVVVYWRTNLTKQASFSSWSPRGGKTDEVNSNSILLFIVNTKKTNKQGKLGKHSWLRLNLKNPGEKPHATRASSSALTRSEGVS